MVWSGCKGRTIQGFGVFLECVQTITSRFYCLHNKEPITLKLAVGFQNILRKNPLSMVSLVSPRERGIKPACNQWRLLVVSNPGGYIIYSLSI